MDIIMPFGGLYTKEGIIFFFKELPETLTWKTPVLHEKDGEIYAVVGENIFIPVERIPFNTAIDNGKALIILAVINEQNFLARVLYTIDLQKETAIELYTLIKAKKLLQE